MLSLHPHQQEAMDELRCGLRTYRSILLRCPTGWGKTFASAYMLTNATSKNKRSLFTVHRKELIDQTAELFDQIGLRYGIIASGYPANPLPLVQIASIDTLRNRLEKTIKPDLLIVDECVHAAARTWLDVINYFSGSKVVGLTATPARTSGEGLGHIFQHMIHGKDVSWLIENKFLSPFRAFAPPPPDLTKIHTRMGEYITAETEEAMDKPKITGDAVDHYLKLCHGKRAVVFAVSVKHSKHIAEAFCAAGISAVHIDGETPKEQRREIIRKFRDDKIKILCNVNIVSEGLSVPDMEAVILLRPTQSLALHLQQIGRALRYKEGKTAYILDHCGNVMRHGLPDDDFEWTLEGKEKRGKKQESKVAAKTCPKCYFVHETKTDQCPSCGFVYEIKARSISEVDGELQEITAANRPAKKILTPEQKQKNDELRQAKTREQLVALATARNYKNPDGFAYKILQQRNAWRTR